MPQYYSGADPTTAFSTGLMSGFQFVEGLRAQRQAVAESKQRMALAQAQNSREEASAARQQESFGLAKQDRLTAIQRQNELDAAHAFASAAIARGGLDKLTPEDQQQLGEVMRAVDPSRTATMTPTELMQFGVANAYKYEPQLAANENQVRQLAQRDNAIGGFLSSIVARNQGTGDASAPSAPAAPSATAAAPSAPAAPVAAPPAASPGPGGSSRGYAHAKNIDLPARQKQVELAQFAYDQAVARWNKGDLAVKATTTVSEAGAALRRAKDMLREGQAVAANAAIRGAAGPGGNIRAGEQASAALGASVAAQPDSPGEPVGTAARAQAVTSTLGRLPSGRAPKTITPEQLSAWKDAIRFNIATTEQFENWQKYGQLAKPEKPSITPLGDGYAGLVTENGVRLIQLPGAGKKGGAGGAESDSQSRLLANDRLEQIRASLSETYGKDQVQTKYNDLLEQVKRDAPNIQLKAGIPLLDPKTGALNIGQADPGEVSALLRWYQQADSLNDHSVWKPWRWFRDQATISGQAAAEAPAAAAGGVIDFSQLQ